VPGGIVLAAGASSRMGSPKALLDWGGTPLARAWVTALAKLGGRVVVVVGSEAPRLREALRGLDLVENPAWEDGGMTSSVLAGFRALGGGPAWVTPVDVPVPEAATLEALARHGPPVVPVCDGRAGHPVGVDAAVVARLSAVRTLRDALADAPRLAVDDPRVLADFDDAAAWARWRDG
jgi:molybdenum cofactor cytidylyltransferase